MLDEDSYITRVSYNKRRLFQPQQNTSYHDSRASRRPSYNRRAFARLHQRVPAGAHLEHGDLLLEPLHQSGGRGRRAVLEAL
eukprot:4784774-Pyramimonas_sp.AAC.1